MAGRSWVREMRPTPIEIDPRQLESRFPLDLCFDQFQPLFCRRDRPAEFVRRVRRQYPKQPVQLKLESRFASQNQVTNMRRIKRTPEDADTH